MSFARHQTFYLRSGWLAKAIEELYHDPKLFSCNNASVRLGIGKNMVQSLRFWIRASGLAAQRKPSKGMELSCFGNMVREYDPFFELNLTWWLIHYHIVRDKDQATSWYYLFNEFSRNELDKITFVEAISKFTNYAVSNSSYRKDYDCIVATYIASKKNRGTPEDNTICPLTKLGLLKPIRRNSVRKSSPSELLPLEVLFLVIKNASDNLYVNVSSLLNESCNIGKVFNLSIDSIYHYLDLMQEKEWVQFSRTAGIDSLILANIDAWDLINKAYQSIDRGVKY